MFSTEKVIHSAGDFVGIFLKHEEIAEMVLRRGFETNGIEWDAMEWDGTGLALPH